MGLAGDIRKRIDKKWKDIRDLEEQRNRVQQQLREFNAQLREAHAALQAYEDVLKMTPVDAEDDKSTEPKLRPNSAVALARDILRKHGQAMHVTKILEALGRQTSHEQKVALSGSLSAYFRSGQIFTRPEANTFGLLEWQQGTLDLPPENPSEKDVTAVLEKVR